MRLPGLLAAALLLATALPLAPATSTPGLQAGPGPSDPLVVVAHIDVGVNPYHSDFRWDDPRASQHPCTYIAAYPCSAQRVDLHLNEADFATAFNLDRATWQGLHANQLYWFAGTKIIGDIALFGNGPTFLYDDHGHGTMTASRSAGNSHSLCRTCLFVSIEGLGTSGVTWAADSGFVDVQTNSWGYLIFVDPPLLPLANLELTAAARKHVVLFASGNGAAGFQGFVSSPTLVMPTGEPGPILVGAHDNGRVLTWPGSPPHVIADGYAGWTALRDSTTQTRPDPLACCTSAATPYAAGGAAAIISEARRILGDPGPGIANGIVAQGPANLVPQGPLQDGVFTLDDFQAVYFHTATLRPSEGPDDGLLHWAADPAGSLGNVEGDPVRYVTNPGQNPYCLGCFSTPLRFTDVPTDVSLWDREGYGAIDPTSVALAGRVLRGEVPLPARLAEDALYLADQTFRDVWFGNV
jgi:hypothetical protein